MMCKMKDGWLEIFLIKPNEQSTKRARYQSSDSDKETTTGTVDAEEWPSNSSGDEEIEEAIPKEQNEGMDWTVLIMRFIPEV